MQLLNFHIWCFILLATPFSPCVPESTNNRVLNWPPQKMIESRTCHPQKWQSPELATPKHTKVLDSVIFGGWQVLGSGIFGGGQSRTLLFLMDSGTQGN